MTDESFVRRYRVAVLGGAFAWRLALFNPFAARGVYDAIEGIVYGVGLGLLPAAALAALAGWIRIRWVLIVAAFATSGIETYCAVSSWRSVSSTSSVALMLSPLIEALTILSTAVLVGAFKSARVRCSF